MWWTTEPRVGAGAVGAAAVAWAAASLAVVPVSAGAAQTLTNWRSAAEAADLAVPVELVTTFAA